MKRFRKFTALFLLAVVLLSAFVGCNAETSAPEAVTVPATTEVFSEETMQVIPTGNRFFIPDDSSVFSLDFAKNMMVLASQSETPDVIDRFEELDVRLLYSKHNNKTVENHEHTSGQIVGIKTLSVNGRERNVIFVILPGTSAGEWYANFDAFPSRDFEHLKYSENFLIAAKEALENLEEVIAVTEDPVFLVSGYSRGAAVGNLLGMLLDDRFGNENVYTYTFATPCTVKKEEGDKVYPNIFNFINPGDMITTIHPTRWGFGRVGTDILLPASNDAISRVTGVVEAMNALLATPSDYYNTKFSTDTSGTSEDGITAFELFSEVADSLGSNGMVSVVSGNPFPSLDKIGKESDLYTIASIFKSKQMILIFMQHAPGIYRELISDWEKEQK